MVGWCYILPVDTDAQPHVSKVGMGLLTEFRGQGLGKKLLSAAIEKAWSQEVSRIELTVYVHNKPAVRLYQELGFETEGRLRNYARIDGVYSDALIMALLRPA